MLERGPYLFGERPTAADIVVHAFLNRLEHSRRYPIPDDLVRANAWYGRLKTLAGRRDGKMEI
jgi:glutathione S-transferase